MSDHDEDEDVCLACEGDGDRHDSDICGYVNEDCPGQCSTDHEVDRGEVMFCWETEQRWRYCSHCGWEMAGRYDGDPAYINGEYVCDPYEHGYRCCDECGEWGNEDYYHYDENREMDLCESCYVPLGNEPGEHLGHCHQCGSQSIHLDTLTEDFLCDHLAVERHMQGVPVEFIGTDIALKVLSGLSLLGRAA